MPLTHWIPVLQGSDGRASCHGASLATLTPVAELDERALILEAQGGSRAAFEELVHRYDRDVLRLALNLMRRPEDARDVYQEAFLKVYKNIQRFGGPGAAADGQRNRGAHCRGNEKAFTAGARSVRNEALPRVEAPRHRRGAGHDRRDGEKFAVPRHAETTHATGRVIVSDQNPFAVPERNPGHATWTCTDVAPLLLFYVCEELSEFESS